MAYKRKLDDFDPNKSDSEDLDYDNRNVSSPRPQRRSHKQSKASTARKANKRRKREGYGGSDDDVDVVSDLDSDEEEHSFSDESEERKEVNPRTGRSVRSVAKKPVTYEESSDAGFDSEGSDSPAPLPVPKRSQGKRSLLVKLHTGPLKMEGGRVTRSRAGSKSAVGRGSRHPTPDVRPASSSGAVGTRRSSRISHSEEQPLVALTDSGKHEQVTRPATATPEPESSRRPIRSGKGLKKPPSAIMEASQEDSQHEVIAAVIGDEAFMSQLAEAAATSDDPPQVQNSPGGSNASQSALLMEEGPEEEVQMEQVVQESENGDDEEDEEAPITRGGGRSLRARRKASTPPASQSQPTRRSLRQKKSSQEQSSDFEPEAEGDDDAEAEMTSEDDLLKPTSRGRSSNDDSQTDRRLRRPGRPTRASTRSRALSARSRDDDAADDALDPDELADEADDLRDYNREMKRPRKREAKRNTENIAFEPNLRSRGPRPDYRVFRPELINRDDEDDGPALAATTVTPQRTRRGGGAGAGYRSLFSVSGPFGGGGGPAPIFGALNNPQGAGAVGDVDSDSSDDEGQMRGGQQGVGGITGMTPTSAVPKPYIPPQAHNSDPIQTGGGALSGNVGKVKDKKALADADPLGVDTNVKFDGVGGLDDHIDRLKEMVALPLLYPEVFQRFHVTPPRGVLFHGPPGTGKTLLARALASSVSSHGKKVTFYMRKGADALSKWVGEAERQLRLLFEEARKNQPSIIFFDEIDGLAPVRSSKQEQIHASIVATLLALMDGMDGRGQVIVIGATNRPDSVDPALRRPGRFDREFYFPLPDEKSRRAILDIHTKGWDPPLQPAFKDQLAELTRGYGGADLRALCTEAALNAVQATYPQIYASDRKLVIDPATIKVTAKDFMLSVNKIVPSSERSAASGAQPLKKEVEPLLRKALEEVTKRVGNMLPKKRKTTALEEAMFEDDDAGDGSVNGGGFEKENMQRAFESSRIFRPRLLIKGDPGMGQFYLGPAVLSRLEGMHVQSFDLGTLMKDSTRSIEAAIIQQFEEVKRHKPSIIYIPNVEVWYRTLDRSAIRTFVGLLRGLHPTDPVLVLGVMDQEEDLDKDSTEVVRKMEKELFGFSASNRFEVEGPDNPARVEFFNTIVDYIKKSPSEYPPDPENRKRRKLAELPVAEEPSEAPKGPSKAEQQAQKKKDRLTLNLLKIAIQPVMDQIKKYKKFRFPVVQDSVIAYLYDEQNPEVLTTDLNEEQRQQQQLFRPFELDKDDKGVPGLREVASRKFYYNLDIVMIENRLSNGYYKRTKDFLADIKRIAKDAKTSEDPDRTLKANEMLANVEVDMEMIAQRDPGLHAECENVYLRELKREEEKKDKAYSTAREEGREVPKLVQNVPHPGANSSKGTTEMSSGPVMLGQEVPGQRPQLFPTTPVQPRWADSGSGDGSGVSSHLTNGSTIPSNKATASGDNEDVEMTDSQMQEGAAGDHQQSSTTQQQKRSQKSFHTQLAYGSQPGEYHNSASTTTSGQKTSDRSSGGAGGPTKSNTQFSNSNSGPNSHGTTRGGEGPNFSNLPPVLGGSQLPDTQEPWDPSQLSQGSTAGGNGAPPVSASAPVRASVPIAGMPVGGDARMGPPPTVPAGGREEGSQSNSSHSNPHYSTAPVTNNSNNGVQGRNRQSSINALLNTTNLSPHPSTNSEEEEAIANRRNLILDENFVHSLHRQLAKSSSGLSVEQLEQVMATLMDVVWKRRKEWNRNVVVEEVQRAFNAVVKDIEACQSVHGPSQEVRI